MTKRSVYRQLRSRKAIALLIVVMGLGAILALRHHAPPPAKGPVVAHTTAAPDEAPITKTTPSYTWQGAPSEPKYLTLPTIHAEGYIQKMGIDQHGQIASPSNISFAGWYTRSVLPGATGLSIIDGHINGRTSADGIFKYLARLRAGDDFTIQRGDGSIVHYQIVSVQTLDEADTLNALFSQDPHTPAQLNLVSCAGDYNAAAHNYTKRIVVSARML